MGVKERLTLSLMVSSPTRMTVEAFSNSAATAGGAMGRWEIERRVQ